MPGLAASLFDTYCLSKEDSFAGLNARATSASYQVVLERNIPLPNGEVMRQIKATRGSLQARHPRTRRGRRVGPQIPMGEDRGRVHV